MTLIRAHLHDLAHVLLVAILQTLKPAVQCSHDLSWGLVAGRDRVHRWIGDSVREYGLGTRVCIVAIAWTNFEAAIFRQLELLSKRGEDNGMQINRMWYKVTAWRYSGQIYLIYMYKE